MSPPHKKIYPGDLVHAAQDKKLDEARDYLERGADPNEVNDFHANSVLMWATKYNDLEFINMLIDKGADVNYVNEDGTTAVMCAAIGCDVETAQLLVARGARLDIINKRGEGPVEMALETQHEERLHEMLRFLVLAGAPFRHALTKVEQDDEKEAIARTLKDTWRRSISRQRIRNLQAHAGHPHMRPKLRGPGSAR